MNFYDVLAAEKWGGGIPTINFFDLLFAQSISGEQWQVYEGTLPATLNANGSDLRRYQVWGNTGGVGDKTINWFDYTTITSITGKFLNSDGTIGISTSWAITDYIPVDGDVFTVGKITAAKSPAICLYNENKQFISGVAYNSENYATITGQNAKFARFSYYINPANPDDLSKIMLTPGTTPPETFVPFGYEVPIGVKSRNIFDDSLITNDYPGAELGRIKLTVKPNTDYTMITTCPIGSGGGALIMLANSPNTATTPNNGVRDGYPRTITSSSDGALYVRYRGNNTGRDLTSYKYAIVEGSTAPDEYQPYFNTTTPIYIGNEPLEKDEYIDYQAGKVYRRTVQLVDSYRQGATSSTAGNTRATSIRYILATGSKISAKLYDTTQGLRFAFVGFNEAGAEEWDATQTASVSNRTYDSGYQTEPFECTDNASYMYVLIVSYTDNRVIKPEDVFGKIGVVYGDIEDIPSTYTPYLQPADPPVALPALPTCEGTTIVDYAGQSVAPEKVLLEYAKGGN